MHRADCRFFLQNSGGYDSLYLQTLALADLLRLNNLNVELIFGDRLTFFDKLKLFLFSRQSIIVVFGSFNPWLFFLLYSSRLALIYHNITPLRFFISSAPLVAIRSLLGSIQLRLFSRKVKIIAVSPFNFEQLANLGFVNVSYFPCILDVKYKKMIPGASGILEKARLIFTGRVVENKNCIALLECIKRVSDLTPGGIDLYIVGGRGKNRAYVRDFSRLVESYSGLNDFSVYWISEGLSQLDLNQLLGTCSLYVSMSLHEGFGLPVCEAILAGVPAVYLECGGTESVLNYHGCVRLNEQDSFVERICDLLTDDIKRKELLGLQFECVQGYLTEALQHKIKPDFIDFLKK